MDLKGVEIMEATKANDIDFGVGDLTLVASSFEALGLNGKVPLKMGHDGPDARNDPTTQFALGWVERVWVEGNKLLADFTDIPERVYEWIKKGMLKFVSVELLRNVKVANRRLPWVLDGVALLGADQPAFGNLKDLQSLTMSRALSLQAESRMTFALGGDRNSMSVEKVKELTKDLINTEFNHAITLGRVMPRERELFTKRYGDTATVELAREWITSATKPDNKGPQTVCLAPAGGERPDEAVSRLAFAHIKQKKADGESVDYVAAVKHVLGENKALGRAYVTMPDDYYRD